MRFRRAILVTAGAIVVGFGVAWLMRTGRFSDPIHDAEPDPVESAHEPTAPASPDRAETATRPRPDAGASAPPDASVTKSQIQRDPRKPGYDAAKLFKIMDDDVIGLFTREPRDEVWAQERENDINGLVLPEFRDADRDVQIDTECHTGTCRVRVHSRKHFLMDVMDAYPLACLATTTVPEFAKSADAQDPYADFYLIFGSDTRLRDGMLARRDGTCAKYRNEWRKEALK